MARTSPQGADLADPVDAHHVGQEAFVVLVDVAILQTQHVVVVEPLEVERLTGPAGRLQGPVESLTRLRPVIIESDLAIEIEALSIKINVVLKIPTARNPAPIAMPTADTTQIIAAEVSPVTRPRD